MYNREIEKIFFNTSQADSSSISIIRDKYPHIKLIECSVNGYKITTRQSIHRGKDAELIIASLIKPFNTTNWDRNAMNVIDDMTQYQLPIPPTNKNVVYTCITGNYDTIKDPSSVDPTWDYICFTDNKNLNSDVWRIVQIPGTRIDNHKQARKIKTMFHLYVGEYDNILWVDASYKLIDIPSNFLPIINPNNKDLAVSKHGCRNCIYDEGNVCIKLRKDSPSIITNQLTRYKIENYPSKNGLAETGILFRKNKLNVIDAMKDWWNEIANHSVRDQLSFNYIMWKHDIIDWEFFPYTIKKDIGILNSHVN